MAGYFKILGLIFITITCAYAERVLEITEGVIRPWTLSFISSKNASDVENIVIKNLNRAGCCKVINENKEMQVADFRVYLSNVILNKRNKKEVKVILENKRKQIIIKTKVQSKALKELAYKISDLIYYKLTGKNGIFNTKIAYIYVEKNKNELPVYVLRIVDVNGEWEQDLLVSNAPIMSPCWSPDGKKLAYVSFEKNRAAIYIHDLDGKRELITRFPGINGSPAWSPDGRSLVVVLTNSDYPKLYALDLKTKKLSQLTKDWYIDTEPNFFPDGKSLVFTSNRGGTPQLYRLNLKNLKVSRLTFHGKYNACGMFTPDGKSLIMLHGRDGLFCIAKQDLKEDTLIELTSLGRYESPSLSPNGEMMVFSEGKLLKVLVIRNELIYTFPVVKGEIREPTWSPYIKIKED